MTNSKHTSSDLVEWCSQDLPCARYQALEAENERLREALEKIAGLGRWETMTEGCNAATDAVSIARATLEARHD